MSWNWYVTNGGASFRYWETEGYSPEITSTTDSLSVSLPSNMTAYEIQVRFDPYLVNINTPPDGDEIKLKYFDGEIFLVELFNIDLNELEYFLYRRQIQRLSIKLQLVF